MNASVFQPATSRVPTRRKKDRLYHAFPSGCAHFSWRCNSEASVPKHLLGVEEDSTVIVLSSLVVRFVRVLCSPLLTAHSSEHFELCPFIFKEASTRILRRSSNRSPNQPVVDVRTLLFPLTFFFSSSSCPLVKCLFGSER